MPNRQPHWPDHCRHLENGDIFIGTTVDRDEICDVYIWKGDLGREVCVRYGKHPHEYQSCFGTPEQWSNPERVVNYHGKRLPAATFDGPAMKLVRAYLQ